MQLVLLAVYYYLIIACVRFRFRVGMKWRGLGEGEVVVKLFAIF